MTSWSTPEQLAAAKDVIAGSIDGWRDPVAHAVGITSATSTEDYEFPHLNTAGQGLLPASVMAKTVGHASGSATYAIGVAELEHAIAGLSPAEACVSLPHPNLAAWREILAEVESNPARSVVAVFVGDLDEPAASDAEVSLRMHLPD